jgi:hypothetical protein
VRSLRIWDWPQGGYIQLHNLFFCRQFLAKPSFRIKIFFRHPGELPRTCRHSGKNGNINNIAVSLCIRMGSAGDPGNSGKIWMKIRRFPRFLTIQAGQSQLPNQY